MCLAANAIGKGMCASSSSHLLVCNLPQPCRALASISSQHHLGVHPEVPRRPTGVQPGGPRVPDPLGQSPVEAGERAGRNCELRLCVLTRNGVDDGEASQNPERAAGVIVQSLQAIQPAIALKEADKAKKVSILNGLPRPFSRQ
jgi:hypothetical protein